MHRSVGAIIKDGNRILMVERTKEPFGWAFPAGHIEENEKPEDALVREVREETSLEVIRYKLFSREFIDWDTCSRGVTGHEFYIYEVIEWSGEIIGNHESKNIKWIRLDDVGRIELEEATKYFLEKIGIIK